MDLQVKLVFRITQWYQDCLIVYRREQLVCLIDIATSFLCKYNTPAWVVFTLYVPCSGILMIMVSDAQNNTSKLRLCHLASHSFSRCTIWWLIVLSVPIAICFNSSSLLSVLPIIWLVGIASEIYSATNQHRAKEEYDTWTTFYYRACPCNAYGRTLTG